jgi:lipoprotein-releasing system ATP-binding protein
MTELNVSEPVVSATGVQKSFVSGDGSVLEVLKGVDLAVFAGESVAIIGESGSGKSTLLHLLGGLDRPSAGEVRVGGQPFQAMDDHELSRVRNASIGFVFQFHHLLREFSVLENVMMPQLIGGRSYGEALDRASSLLNEVGLGKRAEHRPMQLSGGEQQRVAVARALANQPLAILADEPSGNLDPNTSERLHELLFGVSERHGTALVLVTHNMQLASRSGRVLEMKGGELVPATLQAAGLPGLHAG